MKEKKQINWSKVRSGLAFLSGLLTEAENDGDKEEKEVIDGLIESVILLSAQSPDSKLEEAPKKRFDVDYSTFVTLSLQLNYRNIPATSKEEAEDIVRDLVSKSGDCGMSYCKVLDGAILQASLSGVDNFRGTFTMPMKLVLQEVESDSVSSIHCGESREEP